MPESGEDFTPLIRQKIPRMEKMDNVKYVQMPEIHKDFTPLLYNIWNTKSGRNAFIL
jgi:hypothetical protein